MRARTTSPEDAARIILDGIEEDDLQIFVGRDSRMMNPSTVSRHDGRPI